MGMQRLDHTVQQFPSFRELLFAALRCSSQGMIHRSTATESCVSNSNNHPLARQGKWQNSPSCRRCFRNVRSCRNRRAAELRRHTVDLRFWERPGCAIDRCCERLSLLPSDQVLVLVTHWGPPHDTRHWEPETRAIPSPF